MLARLPEDGEGNKAPNWISFAEWSHLRDPLSQHFEHRSGPTPSVDDMDAQQKSESLKSSLLLFHLGQLF